MKSLARLALAALLSLAAAPALAQPTTLPPNTVVGRLGTSAGPPQAIPIATLFNSASLTPTFNGTTITGTDAASISPVLGANGYLQLLNTSAGAGTGGQIWWGTTSGNPFATLSAYAVTGPPPYSGHLIFANRDTPGGARTNKLWFVAGGALISRLDLAPGDFNIPGNSGIGAYSYSQAIVGYAQNSVVSGNTVSGGYFIGDNTNASPSPLLGIFGAYIEGRCGNKFECWGAEIDAQNYSGTDPFEVNPNNLHNGGAATNPIAIAILSQAGGSKLIGGGVQKDSSAWAYVTDIVANSVNVGFRRGLVFTPASIKADAGGNKQAILLAAAATPHEIAWWDATGANIARLASTDGISLKLNGVVIPTISSSVALTNKTLDNTNTVTLKDNLFTLQDDGGTTRQGQFQLSGVTAGQTRILTWPDFNGTIATLAGTEELTNKTLTSAVGKGTWTASGTWTLPAITLGGTVSGGGNQLNNIIIGASTPLAGTFTTFTAQTSAVVGTGSAPTVSSNVSLRTATSTYFNAFDGTHEAFYGVDTNGGLAGTFTNHNMIFRANNTNIFYIFPSGGVAINTSSDPGAGMIYTNAATFMIRTKTSYSTGAAANTGTLTNAPAAGNPTKWIPVDDNGTTRYVPAW